MIKKSFVLAIFLALIIPSIAPLNAYDVVTVPNTSDDYFEYLSADMQRWCIDRPNDLVKEIEEEKIEPSNSTRRKNEYIAELNDELNQAGAKCIELKSYLKTSADEIHLKCNNDHVRIGSECISHTKNCQIQFGKNITGAYNGDQLTSQCTCDAGYTFSDNKCIANTAVPVGEEALKVQLIVLIQKLQTQLAAMIASGNY